MALLVAAGSVASASTSSTGRSPRSRSRLKFSGMLTTNSTSPRASASCASASVLHFPDEVEVAAVADRVQQRASLRPVVGHEHGGGQVLRVGVDREAEQHELHQRDADHHPEGQAVAAHLDELLDDDRPEPRQRERGRLLMLRHLVARVVHEVDEHVLEARRRSAASRTALRAKRRDRVLQRGRVVAADVQRRCRRRTACRTPGRPRSCSASSSRSRAADRPGRQVRRARRPLRPCRG